MTATYATVPASSFGICSAAVNISVGLVCGCWELAAAEASSSTSSGNPLIITCMSDLVSVPDETIPIPLSLLLFFQ